MKLNDLNWDDVPQHVSVIAHKDGTVNFAVNLRAPEVGSCWIAEGDECDITGYVTNPDEGWGSNWRVLESPTTQEKPSTKSEQDIVVEWLGKLAHVLASDYTVNEIYRIGNGSEACMEIFSDCGNITGNQNVAEFINNRYSQLTEQANKLKREALLADIVKAKEAYETLVGELAELEGK